jgi:hypothetical protein
MDRLRTAPPASRDEGKDKGGFGRGDRFGEEFFPGRDADLPLEGEVKKRGQRPAVAE